MDYKVISKNELPDIIEGRGKKTTKWFEALEKIDIDEALHFEFDNFKQVNNKRFAVLGSIRIERAKKHKLNFRPKTSVVEKDGKFHLYVWKEKNSSA